MKRSDGVHLRGKGGFNFLVLLKTDRSTGSINRSLLRRVEQTQSNSLKTFCSSLLWVVLFHTRDWMWSDIWKCFRLSELTTNYQQEECNLHAIPIGICLLCWQRSITLNVKSDIDICLLDKCVPIETHAFNHNTKRFTKSQDRAPISFPPPHFTHLTSSFIAVKPNDNILQSTPQLHYPSQLTLFIKHTLPPRYSPWQAHLRSFFLFLIIYNSRWR